MDLVPLWRLPSHHSSQCCSDGLRNDPSTFLWRERGVFAVASAFRSFIFKLDKATCVFLNIFFPKLNTEQGLLPERQLGLVSSVISDLTKNVTNGVKGEVMVIFGIDGRATIQGVKLRLNGNPKMTVQSGER